MEETRQDQHDAREDVILEQQDGSLRWTTRYGDVVTVWQAAEIGRPVDWRWHVQARNGEIVGQGEGHSRRRIARMAAMRHHGPLRGPYSNIETRTDVEPPLPGSAPPALLQKLEEILHVLRNDPFQGIASDRELARKVAEEIAPLLVAAPELEPAPAPEAPPAALVEKLHELLEHDENTRYYDVPGSGRSAADRYASALLPFLVSLPALPDGELETTWPAAWFSYVDTAPDVGDEVLVNGVPHQVTLRLPDGVPDRIRVRLTRSEIRRG